MLNLNHKKLEVWKRSMDLVKEVYKITDSYPVDEKFGLVSQMRRASVSVSSNISEGVARQSTLERKRFYEIARSSLVEVDTQIEISVALQFIKVVQSKRFSQLANEIFAMLSKMITK